MTTKFKTGLWATLMALMMFVGYKVRPAAPTSLPAAGQTTLATTGPLVVTKDGGAYFVTSPITTALQFVSPAAAGGSKIANIVKAVASQPTGLKLAEAAGAALVVTKAVEVIHNQLAPNESARPTDNTSGASPRSDEKDTGIGPVSARVANRFIVGLSIQGGVAATLDHATGFVVGAQWLKRGTTDDPRHLRWAFLTPVFFGAPNVHEVGLLPFSWNLATAIPHQPLTNLWVSPYVGGNPRHPSRVGVTLTATF